MTNWPSAAVIGAIAAFALNRAYDWYRRSERSRALLSGILLEIAHAEKAGQDYAVTRRTKVIWSPAYRLTTDFTKEGLLFLSENGSIRSEDIQALHTFYICADEANRCLEQLVPLVEDHQSNEVSKNRAILETRRTRIKFRNLLESIPLARAAVLRALDSMWWHEPV